MVVYAFNEERIENTALYYVNEQKIKDISNTAKYEIETSSIKISSCGFGFGKIRICGSQEGNENTRCIVVLVYKLPELDYFASDAGEYMKSSIQLHSDNGIRYAGFYSDEMHIQLDWDLVNHFGHDSELNLRYYTKNLAREYAARYGSKYSDFMKFLVFFAYHQHDFIQGEEGRLPSQHVFGHDEKSIYDTWLFRKRYFEMLQRKVVDLCLDTKDFAEDIFGGSIMTKAHSTWQESPTCDCFYEGASFSEYQDSLYSRYDYTPDYAWSSSIRENMAACYDYFKCNEYLSGGGTDHAEGGFLDRNYYGNAFACSLAEMNRFSIAYYGCWGIPLELLTALRNVAMVYGNINFGREYKHNIVQGITPRSTDILTIYPLDLNYVEERFGSWMVQYGYTNYITEDKLIKHFIKAEDGILAVRDSTYRTLLVFYSPFISSKTMDIIEIFLNNGGRVVWTSVYPLDTDSNDRQQKRWMELFGIASCYPAYRQKTAKNKKVSFINILSSIKDMQILTDMLPDMVYPVTGVAKGCKVLAMLDDEIVGTLKEYPNDGAALYLGFRPRDDQSQSTGEDVDTLFSILNAIGGYSEVSCERMSRETGSPYVFNSFRNGTVSMANHVRLFCEEWDGKFFRNEEEDRTALEGKKLPETAIILKDFKLCGHSVTYNGKEVLSYRVNQKGELIGFAGNDTTGINIDGKEYRFTEKPAEITWSEIEVSSLQEGVQKAYVLNTDFIGALRIPMAFEKAGEFKVEMCEKELYNTDSPVKFEINEKEFVLNIGEKEKGKWIIIYC